MAIFRAICKLARAIRDLKAQPSVNLEVLSDYQLFNLYKDILEGKFTGELPKETMQARTTKSHRGMSISHVSSRRTLQSYRPGTMEALDDSLPLGDMVMLPADELAEMKDNIAKLTASVELIQQSLANLYAKGGREAPKKV